MIYDWYLLKIPHRTPTCLVISRTSTPADTTMHPRSKPDGWQLLHHRRTRQVTHRSADRNDARDCDDDDFCSGVFYSFHKKCVLRFMFLFVNDFYYFKKMRFN